MTLAVNRVREAVQVPIGINMIRSDALSGLAMAAVTGAEFIRVNVHYGMMAAVRGVGGRGSSRNNPPVPGFGR